MGSKALTPKREMRDTKTTRVNFPQPIIRLQKNFIFQNNVKEVIIISLINKYLT